MAVSRINEAGLNVNQYGNRNFIINGAMQVAQRGTSSTGVGASNNVYPTCDRWEIETANSAGRATMTQESDGPDGFANSIKLACTTADTSVAAGEVFRLQQVIEAQNLQSLAKGTSSAKQFTLSFYVKGNAAATYNVEIYDLDNTRHICASFNVTTSWNRISFTFDGDTTGAINDDNGGGFQVGIYLHAGSNYTSGTLATSWASVTNANRSSSSNTSFFDSTSRTFFITGVQLEVGDTATDFEHRSFADELAKCQRYCVDLTPTSAPYLPATGAVPHNNTAVAVTHVPLPVTMRAAPSVTVAAASDYSLYDGSTFTCTGVTVNGLGPNGGGINFSVSSGLTARSALGIYTNGDKRTLITAEL
jgi:hypothetical protein